jgi:hypothetical protein
MTMPRAHASRGGRRLLPAIAAALAGLLGATAQAQTDPAANVQLHGFVDSTAAYTYEEPAHWSRLVTRLYGSATGSFSEDVKWKLSGRVEVDPLYMGSDFYLDRVKRNERVRFVHGENYVDIARGDAHFTLGAQNIVWGEVVGGLFFADVVSARDLTDFILPGFDVLRIPQWAARAEYFAGDSHFEAVWIPVPIFDRFGKPGSDFYPAALPSPTPQDVADLFRDPKDPPRGLARGNYGVRANTRLAGWDVAGFYYRSYSTAPTFYRLPGESPAQPFVYEPRHDRIWQVGATASQDFESFVLRAETVFTHGQGYSVTDPDAAEGVDRRNTFDYIVSLDWPLPEDTRLNVQAFQRVFAGGGRDFAVRNDGPGMSVLVSTRRGRFEPEFLWIQNFRDAGGLLRPRLNWYPAKNYRVAFGADVFTGPSNGFFGRYDNRDRVYAELRYDF